MPTSVRDVGPVLVSTLIVVARRPALVLGRALSSTTSCRPWAPLGRQLERVQVALDPVGADGDAETVGLWTPSPSALTTWAKPWMEPSGRLDAVDGGNLVDDAGLDALPSCR